MTARHPWTAALLTLAATAPTIASFPLSPLPPGVLWEGIPVRVEGADWGGSGNDFGMAVSADGMGFLYLAGTTDSLDFPVRNPLQGTRAGTVDGFVMKVDAVTWAVVWATYLGGSSDDRPEAIAVGRDGAVYVAGSTWSTDFPSTSAFQPESGGRIDGFLAKIAPAGDRLLWSTYFGGSSDDRLRGLYVDDQGKAFVSGSTYSTDLPVKYAAQPQLAGDADAFIAKFAASGEQVLFSTYLGGPSFDAAWDVVADPFGRALVVGESWGTGFPIVDGLFGPGEAGYPGSGILARLNATGGKVLQSTYLRGPATDLVLDAAGAVFVTGSFWEACCDATYTYLLKISPSLDALESFSAAGDYSAYAGLSVHPDGAFLAGYTWYGRGEDGNSMSMVKRGPDGRLLYSTNLGYCSYACGLADSTLAPSGIAYAVGGTEQAWDKSDVLVRGVVECSLAPCTDATLQGAGPRNGWWRGPVNVTLTSRCTCEVVGTFVAMDGGALERTNRVTVQGDGTHRVAYFSTSKGDASERPRSQAVWIDDTPPVVDLVRPRPSAVYVDDHEILVQASTATVAGFSTVVVGNVTLRAMAEDLRSGVERVEFFVDGLPLATRVAPPYEAVWHAADAAGGEHVITVQARDRVGHVQTSQFEVTTVPRTSTGVLASLA